MISLNVHEGRAVACDLKRHDLLFMIGEADVRLILVLLGRRQYQLGSHHTHLVGLKVNTLVHLPFRGVELRVSRDKGCFPSFNLGLNPSALGFSLFQLIFL